MEIVDKVAMVTGGTKGIGLAVVQALLYEGYKVGFTGRTGSSIEKAIEQLNSEPEYVIGIVADVRDRHAQEKAITQIIRKWQRLDVLVANAGVGHFASIEDITVEQWAEVMDINLTGVFHSVQVCVPHLKKTKGYIITIASLAGTNFFATGSAYNASKFGLVGFTQAIMLDLRHQGIKVSTIMPGSVATEFNSHVPSPSDDWKIQSEDIGQIVVDLLKMPARTLPSKVEVRPSIPKSK